MSHGQRPNTPSLRYEAIPETYDQLLALYALRPIHNDRELDQATEIVVWMPCGRCSMSMAWGLRT